MINCSCSPSKFAHSADLSSSSNEVANERPLPLSTVRRPFNPATVMPSSSRPPLRAGDGIARRPPPPSFQGMVNTPDGEYGRCKRIDSHHQGSLLRGKKGGLSARGMTIEYRGGAMGTASGRQSQHSIAALT